MSLKDKALSVGSAATGGLSILGGANVCHAACLGIITLLTAVGITVAGMPLMFLQKVAVPFWIAAVIMLAAMLALWKFKGMCFSQNLLLANAGLIIAGTPFAALAPYQTLFWLVGGALVAVSVCLFINDVMKGRVKPRTKRPQQSRWHPILAVGVIVLAGLFAFNLYLFGQVNALQQPRPSQQAMPMMGPSMSRMSFTAFDAGLAQKLMDKDSDGKCDACGMPIDQCIASGMMQCRMDPNATIGNLGTQHIHADWKIFINGKPFDWAPYQDRHERQMAGDPSIKDTSAFIHIHPAQAPEKGGDVLHMHATGVPLSMFFESLGMKFDKNCLVVSEKEKYCADGKNTLKFSVNSKTNDQYGDYVFTPLDKILVSYGPKSEDVTLQFASITNFGGAH